MTPSSAAGMGPRFKAGVYLHFSGIRCIATGLARHVRTGELFVIYCNQASESMEIMEYNSPGKESWCDTVDAPNTPGAVNGRTQRFAWIRPTV